MCATGQIWFTCWLLEMGLGESWTDELAAAALRARFTSSCWSRQPPLISGAVVFTGRSAGDRVEVSIIARVRDRETYAWN